MRDNDRMADFVWTWEPLVADVKSLLAGEFGEVKDVRRVRTPEGARKYGEPIGSPIRPNTPDAKLTTGRDSRQTGTMNTTKKPSYGGGMSSAVRIDLAGRKFTTAAAALEAYRANFPALTGDYNPSRAEAELMNAAEEGGWHIEFTDSGFEFTKPRQRNYLRADMSARGTIVRANDERRGMDRAALVSKLKGQD